VLHEQVTSSASSAGPDSIAAMSDRLCVVKASLRNVQRSPKITLAWAGLTAAPGVVFSAVSADGIE
jgi:hypothetical protein